MLLDNVRGHVYRANLHCAVFPYSTGIYRAYARMYRFSKDKRQVGSQNVYCPTIHGLVFINGRDREGAEESKKTRGGKERS